MVTTLTLRTRPPADRILRIPLPAEAGEGPLDVVVVIVPASPSSPAVPLAGRWREWFPPDFDVEEALREIRREWEKEWLDTESAP